ncbi:MAG: hypothetical protein WDO13_13120 [Verrucomicrobiota bacterium]
MAQGRDCSLPDGMKDLLELVHEREQEDRSHRQQLMQLKSLLETGDLVLQILSNLRQRIDQDLLFCEHYDLVSPHLHQAAREEWNRVLKSHPLAVTERTRCTIIEATVEIAWNYLCLLRVRYLEHRDEGRQLEF